MATCIVLLGAPGCGKSTIGSALGALGYRWREWEPVLLARWGSAENFVANKGRALPEHHAELRAFIGEPGPPAVLETTGISDGAFLDGLARDFDLFVARLDVSLDEALRRVGARAMGQHLSDDPDRIRRTWQAFQELVAPNRAHDLVIDTALVGAEEAAALIHHAVAAKNSLRRPRGGT